MGRKGGAVTAPGRVSSFCPLSLRPRPSPPPAFFSGFPSWYPPIWECIPIHLSLPLPPPPLQLLPRDLMVESFKLSKDVTIGDTVVRPHFCVLLVHTFTSTHILLPVSSPPPAVVDRRKTFSLTTSGATGSHNPPPSPSPFTPSRAP